MLSNIQKGKLFEALAGKSQYEVGIEFGLGDKFNNNVKLLNYVQSVVKEVREDPKKFDISKDVLRLVERGMENRKLSGKGKPRELEVTGKLDAKDLVLTIRNKALVLLNKKLDYLAKHPRAFRGESIMQIAKVAGIAFDKAQIVKGEATEHIMLKAKIDDRITSEEAVTQLLKFRESTYSKE